MRRRWGRPNVLGGLGALIWLVIVALPIYALVAATLERRDQYLSSGALAVPTHPTWANYNTVLHSSFFTYLMNTLVVAVISVAIVIVLAVPLGYVVVRSRNRWARLIFRILVLGLAIPAQATIVPLYLLITKLGLYDSLLAIILPTAAFAMPVCVLILVGSMRDISEELYEAMALDGATSWRVLLQLVVPLSRAGISTVIVYAALQAWNGFLFPLILTQSENKRVLTLGLYNYVGQFYVNFPALLAAVVLSGVPIFVVYLIARRSLVSGLMGVGGK
jgi:xylobiose transport system permease protein